MVADKIAKALELSYVRRQCGRLTQRPTYQSMTVEVYNHLHFLPPYTIRVFETRVRLCKLVSPVANL